MTSTKSPPFRIADEPLTPVYIGLYNFLEYPVILSGLHQSNDGRWSASGRPSARALAGLLGGVAFVAFGIAVPMFASHTTSVLSALLDPWFAALTLTPILLGAALFWVGLIYATTEHSVVVNVDSITVRKRRLWKESVVTAPATEFVLQIVPFSQLLPTGGGTARSYLLCLKHESHSTVWLAQSRGRISSSGAKLVVNDARDAIRKAREWMKITGLSCEIPCDDALLAGTSRSRGEQPT